MTVSNGPITREEMIEMFGSEAPIEAINLIWNAPDNKTLADIRRELREIAAKQGRPQCEVQIDDADPLAQARAGMMMRLEARTQHGTKWVPVYPAQVEMFSKNGATIRAFEVEDRGPVAQAPKQSLPDWQKRQLDRLLDALRDWRNEDNEEAVTLARSDVCALLDGFYSMESSAAVAQGAVNALVAGSNPASPATSSAPSAHQLCPRCNQHPADNALLGSIVEGHICGACWTADREAGK